MKAPALHWQILIALFLALITGLTLGQSTTLFGISVLEIFNFVGTFFLNALKMLIVPLIVTSIIAGMVNLAATGGNLGRLGLKTMGWYILTSILAILTGLILVNVIAPGIVDGQAGAAVLGLDQGNATAIADKVAGRSTGDIAAIFLRLVPPNIVGAAAQGQMLGLIVFSLLVGGCIMRLQAEQQLAQRTFWQGLSEVMLMITHLVMKLAPLGVFALVAKVVMNSPDFWATFKQLSVFAATVLAALAVHAFVTLPILLKTVGGISPLKHYKAIAPALLTAFSTASSAATLPVTMRSLRERAGVSEQTSGFVLPLGATINMDGTALYECVVVIFIAQAYGLDLTFGAQFGVVALALLTSIGVAGIPSASLVAITLILGTLGLPLEGIAVIWIFDRLLDMCRTAVNVGSDACGAAVIARLEGEKTTVV